MNTRWFQSQLDTIRLFDRGEKRAFFCLVALIVVLVFAAMAPSISNKLSHIPGFDLGDAPLLVLIIALFTVAGLGIALIYVNLKVRSLEAARRADIHDALHDAMTGSANRRHFEHRLEQLVADKNPSHSLLMIDLDRFKPVNDLYGHAAGDALLKDIARGFSRLVTHEDMVARLGGDEFAILLRNKKGAPAAKTALAVLDFVKKYRLNWQGQRISVGTSIGLVQIDQKGLTPATLLAAADEALYAAKEAGRGSVFLAKLDSPNSNEFKFTRVDATRSAADKNAKSHVPEDGRRQELHAVAMASLITNKSKQEKNRKGSRRRHVVSQWIMLEPVTIGDRLSPGMKMRELIEDASGRSDGGADLARWIMVMTLQAASRVNPAVLGRIGFVVPIPATAAAKTPELAVELMRMNALAPCPIKHLTFVLHNVASVYDSPAIDKFQEGLKSRDAHLAFEIRASTLDVLAPLRYAPYDEVHLGRELSKNIRSGTSAYAAVEALISIAEQKGTAVVAPNVDHVSELRHLAALGVTRFSGPVVNPPKPLQDVLAMVENKI